jgi:hypothetical protein
VDQGAIGIASLHYLSHVVNLMTWQYWDRFHRQWNDMKLSFAKSTCKAWYWITGYTVICNINYAPFGSGAVHQKKKDMLNNVLQSLDSSSSEWRAVVPLIAAEKRVHVPVNDGQHAQFWDQCFESVPCVQKKGTLVKLMRWHSWFQGVKDHQGQFQLLKFLVRWNSDKGSPPEVPEVVLPVQEVKDKDAVNKLKMQMGSINMIPYLVTDHSLWVVTMLQILVQPFWAEYGRRCKDVLTPRQGYRSPSLKHQVGGSWNCNRHLAKAWGLWFRVCG